MKKSTLILVCLVFLMAFAGCSSNSTSASGQAGGAPAKSPDVYKARFDTSKGAFVVEVHRDWAPNGADRFHELVTSGFYNEARFFRVVPGFVVQWGISADPKVAEKWREKNIQDDPATQSNLRGFITFATRGPNTRTTQLFINLADNARLDAMGFSPFGKVIEGMDIVDQLYSGYGETPQQQLIETQGNEYLKGQFPQLDYIKTTKVE
ncbi:MAG TPA: peptidylprolyl isomerase [Bryobacteraceae bacterium]|nr:peptidylprolyl isomerase [Bryobacteraceae bacterium]